MSPGDYVWTPHGTVCVPCLLPGTRMVGPRRGRAARAAAMRVASLGNKDPDTLVKVRGLAKGCTLLKARLSLGDLLAGLRVGGDDNTTTLDFTVQPRQQVPDGQAGLEKGASLGQAAHLDAGVRVFVPQADHTLPGQTCYTARPR